jgi:gamma-glutamylaminecyclotransferase
MSEKNLIFAYGTLKQGFSNNHYLSGSKFIGTGWTKQKYAMRISYGIPFIIMSEPLSQIYGELYQVDDFTLETLDDLEGHPNWYRREQVEIYLDDGNHSIVKGWVYFNEDNSGTLVPSGIYTSNRF